MSLFASQSFTDFVIALGYKGTEISTYLSNMLSVGKNSASSWQVQAVDTGLHTATGGRIKRLRDWLDPAEPFMLTYGDGLADIDLHRLLQFHRQHGKLATVTIVQRPDPFGRVRFEGNQVTEFCEKPTDCWINGGFFVLSPNVLDYIDDDDTVWEKQPLERLTAAGQLMCYQHQGFWQCMDHPADFQKLNYLWVNGQAPWKTWIREDAI